MRVAGQWPATLPGSAVDRAVSSLAEGREAGVDGAAVRFTGFGDGASLPVWMAAYGPRALALAGKRPTVHPPAGRPLPDRVDGRAVRTPPRRRAVTRRRSPSAWPRPPM